MKTSVYVINKKTKAFASFVTIVAIDKFRWIC